VQRLVVWVANFALVYWWWRVFNDEHAGTPKMAVAWLVVLSALGVQWWYARRATQRAHRRQFDMARLYSPLRSLRIVGFA